MQLNIQYLSRLFQTSILAGLLLCFVSCSDDDTDPGTHLEVPSTYTFTRDGSTSVSFSGQTDRLNMLAEMKGEVGKGDNGEEVDADALANMFANENTSFSDADLNASTKQIENKTFVADIQFFKDLFQAAELVSKDIVANSTAAEEGQAGMIERGTSGTFISVNAKGWEFTQFVEKGLMGALIYNQIFNTYLTDAEIGSDVDNVTILEGKNYTDLEHHFDEAYGYFGAPIDYAVSDPDLTSDEDRFWVKYTHDVNAVYPISEDLMKAYITARTAIVNNDHATKDVQVDAIYEMHELVAAGTAIHYINSALEDLNANDTGNLFHHLSEGYNFVKAIKYSPVAALTSTQITTILETDFGTDGNFWTASQESLNTAKSTLTTAYPKLAAVADDL
ncbi:MAG: DUF4856 domain-containing protein [Cyclobacteriaceae bacterium]